MKTILDVYKHMSELEGLRLRESVGRRASLTTRFVFSQLPQALLCTELSTHTHMYVHTHTHTSKITAKVMPQESLALQCPVQRAEV